VVVPAHNEEGVVEELLRRIRDALEGHRLEVIVVDDGSTDGSAALLDRLAAADERIKILHLSRNFGHQAALLAGLTHARGDAVIVMDADLQDDPGALPTFVDRWKAGNEVVYAIRVKRKEGPIKRALFHAFYRILNALSTTPLPNDAGNFGLIDRRVARLIAGSEERDRYYPGLRWWVGFRQVGVEVERGPRYDDVPRVSPADLLRLAKSALFSFSSVPLAIFYLIAALSAVMFVAFGGFTLYHRLVTGLAIPGWTSTILTACFFGALNALGIAILGEYVMRVYDQVRGRPVFIVDRAVNLTDDAAGPSGSSPAPAGSE
jgi:dolichol-phosphate mannosyltransferase